MWVNLASPTSGKAHEISKRKLCANDSKMAVYCYGCEFLTISTDVERKIVENHYIEQRVDWKYSFFFANVLPSRQLFSDVTRLPRVIFEDGGDSKGRRIYFLTYDRVIGIYPYKAGRPQTRTVRLVVDYVSCPVCRKHRPKTIVTIYPFW